MLSNSIPAGFNADTSPAANTREKPALIRIHRMLAAAVAEAGRTMGRGVGFEVLLAGLTDGRDDSSQIDVLGVTQAARRYGLMVDPVGRHGPAPALGSCALILVDTMAKEDQVLLFPATELADEYRAMRFRPDGMKQPFIYEPGQFTSGPGKLWLRVDRAPFTPEGQDGASARMPDSGKMEWLWEVLRREKKPFQYALIASMATTILGLFMPLFSMVLFNSVAPNGATATLLTLTIGMLIAAIADFVLKELRAHVVDVAARRMDVVLSRKTFEHLLDVKLEAWKGSAGTQADMLRGFSTVQEVFTSSVLLLLIDLPFGLVALGMVFVIGGHLGWIPVFWAVLMILTTWRMQASVEKTTRLSMRLGQERHGTLVESINALEAVRAVGGERTLRRRWRDQSAMSALAAGSNRMLSQLVNGLTGLFMQLQSLSLLGAGAWLVGSGQLTLGALIAANMLAARALAPFAQLVALGMRLEGARVAAGFMTRFFSLPRVTQEGREFISRNDFRGGIDIETVNFSYPAMAGVQNTLSDINLQIRPGERVAILGRMGSGKSTLLKIMAGVLTPQKGRVMLDGADMAQLDVISRRKIVGYMQQDPVLISGTLKENICLGRPDADDSDVLAAAKLAGVDAFTRLHPDGYSMRIEEGGRGLSQGQKQAVGLAQILLNETLAILLDEPSSAFDMDAEQRLVRALATSLASRTLVVVTHRPAFLQLVTRVIVIDGGRIVLDGPRDEVLQRLAQGGQAAVPTPPPTR